MGRYDRAFTLVARGPQTGNLYGSLTDALALSFDVAVLSSQHLFEALFTKNRRLKWSVMESIEIPGLLLYWRAEENGS